MSGAGWGLVVVSASLSMSACVQIGVAERDRLPVVSSIAGSQPLDLDSVAAVIEQRTNELRRGEGLAPLAAAPELKAAALAFARYMARTDRYGHRADGSEPAQRARRRGYVPCAITENIAYVYREAALTEQELGTEIVDGWADSPKHRANMLDPAVLETGVAVAHSQRSGHYYSVQLLASRECCPAAPGR